MSKKTFKDELFAHFQTDDSEYEWRDVSSNSNKFVKVKKHTATGVVINDMTDNSDLRNIVRQEFVNFKNQIKVETTNYEIYLKIKKYIDELNLPMLEYCSYDKFIDIY